MSQVIFATVEDGLLRPDEAIGLTPGTKVRLTVEPCVDSTLLAIEACDALDELCEEIPIDSHGNRLSREQLHDRR